MRFAAAAVACLVLVSCSSRQLVAPDRQAAENAYYRRAISLNSLDSWELAGKLSIDDGQDGGSGRLSWRVHENESLMKFRGALGKASWQLESGTGFAELQKSDGSVTRADTASELLEAELGWYIPVESLKSWALGVAAPGDPELLDLDDYGRVLAMQQSGWNITFSRYREFGDFELPGRMDAVRGRYRLKMAVSKWTLQHPAQTDE